MKVLLEIDRPVKGQCYASKVKDQKLIFKLVEVEETNTTANPDAEEFPGFGSMPWLKGFDEKEIKKAKKGIAKEIKR